MQLDEQTVMTEEHRQSRLDLSLLGSVGVLDSMGTMEGDSIFFYGLDRPSVRHGGCCVHPRFGASIWVQVICRLEGQ